MEDIAAEAGYAAPSLYSYFESKEAILLYALKAMAEGILEAIRPTQDRTEPFRKRFSKMVHNSFEVAGKRRGLFGAFMGQGVTFSSTEQSAMHLEMMGFRTEAIDRLSEWMVQGIEERVLRDEPPEVLAQAYMGLTNSFLMGWMLDWQNLSLEKQAETVVRFFIDGAGLREGQGRVDEGEGGGT
jgi:AcrR family transcriptional regulator